MLYDTIRTLPLPIQVYKILKYIEFKRKKMFVFAYLNIINYLISGNGNGSVTIAVAIPLPQKNLTPIILHYRTNLFKTNQMIYTLSIPG
jgi:hypothetical protein